MHEYNEERYVSELIQSNLNQAFQEFVFINVEDDPSDKTYKIVSMFECSKIKFLYKTIKIRN